MNVVCVCGISDLLSVPDLCHMAPLWPLTENITFRRKEAPLDPEETGQMIRTTERSQEHLKFSMLQLETQSWKAPFCPAAAGDSRP